MIDAMGDERIVLEGDIGSADAGVSVCHEGTGDVEEPMGVGGCVIVQIRDDFTFGSAPAGVAGGAQARVVLSNETDVEAAGDFTGVVPGTVVDDDDLEFGVVQLTHGFEGLLDGARAVVTANDY